MSNEAKGPYTSVFDRTTGRWNVIGPSKAVVAWFNPDHSVLSDSVTRACNIAHSQALTSQAERVKELEEDREWLRSQWERHRKALNAIAWGEYDNVAFCRRLAQDELAIGVKVANDRAAATVAALTPKEPQ